MRLILKLIFIAFLAVNQSFGQAADTLLKTINTGNSLELSYRAINEKGEPVLFTSFSEDSESFPGGWDSLYKFIRLKLIYPISAIDDNYQGKVYTSFTVNCEGKVDNIEIVRGVRYDLDSACLHVISIFPRFKPFRFPGSDKILIQYLLPITFILTN